MQYKFSHKELWNFFLFEGSEELSGANKQKELWGEEWFILGYQEVQLILKSPLKKRELPALFMFTCIGFAISFAYGAKCSCFRIKIHLNHLDDVYTIWHFLLYCTICSNFMNLSTLSKVLAFLTSAYPQKNGKQLQFRLWIQTYVHFAAEHNASNDLSKVCDIHCWRKL